MNSAIATRSRSARAPRFVSMEMRPVSAPTRFVPSRSESLSSERLYEPQVESEASDSPVSEASDSAAEAVEVSSTYAPPALASVGELDEDSISIWWRHVQSFPLLSSAQEVALAKRIEAGDEDAFNQMVESNLRLVANIARKCRRFAGNSLHLCDLIQEGSIGLMRAVRKFDYRKGYKFSTYACYWIRQAVMRSIAERGRSVRLPVHVVESVSKVERARILLTQELQRVPTLPELARYLQLPEHKVGEILERGCEPMSLDLGIGDAEESVLADFIEDVRACSPEENAAHDALQTEIRSALGSLTEREAQVITLRFGLDGSNSSRTLDEVGALMQLTRERIRQIEKTAMKRLRSCAPLQETARCMSRASHSGHTASLA